MRAAELVADGWRFKRHALLTVNARRIDPHYVLQDVTG
jgi:hypothetical protein